MILYRAVANAASVGTETGIRNHLVIIALAIVFFGLIDLLWLPFSNVEFSPRNWVDIGQVTVALIAAWAVAKFVLKRLGSDAGAMASAIRYLSKSLLMLVSGSAVFIPLTIATTVFMYLASATARPLMDEQFASIDASLGFDWLSFLAASNRNAIWSSVLFYAYHALGPQVPMVFIIQVMRQRWDRVLEFIALMAVSSLFTGPLMAMFPTAGAYTFYKPAPELFSNLTAQAGMWHYQTLLSLRSGAPYELIVSKADGLVTFPSFHTALGILVIHALRDVRPLFVVALIVNAVMIVSTLPEGGHHLIDVVVGAAIGALSVAIVRILGRVPKKAVASEARSTAGT
ncbi:phosphatase PAP2 family protein [Mesorhizobium sp. B1-1-8]|uniref:phosphatase PAP2 family protein n=1 Tax=Mesorhizobium sp. B1-1-8 TaxID=2589976 RepID=UPI0011290CCA|nr:phosphatase PAP2 family protein [Mesorhizobium sp. B1-1-8]UCI07289.1 phosphatase PAP2 family protein [Mesorhizobium sp. B1-1-8]